MVSLKLPSLPLIISAVDVARKGQWDCCKAQHHLHWVNNSEMVKQRMESFLLSSYVWQNKCQNVLSLINCICGLFEQYETFEWLKPQENQIVNTGIIWTESEKEKKMHLQTKTPTTPTKEQLQLLKHSINVQSSFTTSLPFISHD